MTITNKDLTKLLKDLEGNKDMVIYQRLPEPTEHQAEILKPIIDMAVPTFEEFYENPFAGSNYLGHELDDATVLINALLSHNCIEVNASYSNIELIELMSKYLPVLEKFNADCETYKFIIHRIFSLTINKT